MATLRRSVRKSARKKQEQQTKVKLEEREEDEEGEGQRWSDDESSLEEEEEEDDFDSDRDEWKPEKRRKSSRSRTREEDSEDEEEEDDVGVEDDGEEVVLRELEDVVGSTKKRKRPTTATKVKKIKVKIGGKTAEQRAAIDEDEDEEVMRQAEEAYAAQQEAEEQEDAREEAKRLWDEARARKAARENPSDGSTAAAVSASPKPADAGAARAGPEKRSLDSWLGVDAPAWPTTTPEAMVNDRDSLFVGYVYALESSSASQLSRLLSHLARTVHPQSIPTERLPPAVRHLATTRRGSTHDMHAWRCLALKRGRNGLGGPEDFGLEEGQEDDGEKHGGREIAKAVKELGATDVLVVVSRWYGGTMLGPVRFQHIYKCAHAALSRYLLDEVRVQSSLPLCMPSAMLMRIRSLQALAPMREQLKGLDAAIADLRLRLGASSSQQQQQQQPPASNSSSTTAYADLDPEKAARLISARTKTIEMLEKRLAAAR